MTIELACNIKTFKLDLKLRYNWNLLTAGSNFHITRNKFQFSNKEIDENESKEVERSEFNLIADRHSRIRRMFGNFTIEG